MQHNETVINCYSPQKSFPAKLLKGPEIVVLSTNDNTMTVF